MNRQVSMQFGKPGTVSGSGRGGGAPKEITLTPTSLLATTGTDPTVFACHRSGNVVYMNGYLHFTSAASGTYNMHDIFTGAPQALSMAAVGEYTICGYILMDGSSTPGALIGVRPDGTVFAFARGVTLASKKGPFFAVYIVGN